jgi:hypothetical protein
MGRLRWYGVRIVKLPYLNGGMFLGGSHYMGLCCAQSSSRPSSHNMPSDDEGWWSYFW